MLATENESCIGYAGLSWRMATALSPLELRLLLARTYRNGGAVVGTSRPPLACVGLECRLRDMETMWTKAEALVGWVGGGFW
eukprot:50666-Eustigmatos_ZCMA.PRE.1